MTRATFSIGQEPQQEEQDRRDDPIPYEFITGADVLVTREAIRAHVEALNERDALGGGK